MISVVIPLYNKEESIGSTIKSVLDQEMNQFELIIVNDGSDDDSLRVVEEINDSRIRVITQENAGVSAARNRGIMEARYPYISFLDADDLWSSEFLSETTRLINEYPNVGVWATAWSFIKHGKIVEQQFNLEEGFEGIIENYWTLDQPVNLLISSCITVRKSLFSSAGLFDTRITYGEDQDMWVRLLLHSKLAYCSRQLAYYRLSAENRLSYKHHKYEKRWLYYNEKFNEYRNNDSDFRRYIDFLCIHQAYKNFRRHRNAEYFAKLTEHVCFHLQRPRWKRIHQSPAIWGMIYRLRARLICSIERIIIRMQA
jgi:glycosyltransferase involved in cell wall biosynthesis